MSIAALADGRRTAMNVPEVRYAKSGDTHVAYQVVGTGNVDIVLGLPFVSHLLRCALKGSG